MLALDRKDILGLWTYIQCIDGDEFIQFYVTYNVRRCCYEQELRLIVSRWRSRHLYSHGRDRPW
jgi:hypothetical protein